MRNAEKTGSTTRKPDTSCNEMFYAIGDGLSNLASSDNKEDEAEKPEDEDDTELGNQNKDDEPGWVRGTICKSVKQRMQRIWYKQIGLTN